MRKNVKIGVFVVAIIILLIIIKYDFIENNSWNSWNLPLTGEIILIDPGHGGPDGGASAKDVVEKDIALNVSLKVRNFLQHQGALVLMTRETDTDLADKETRGYSRRKIEDLKRRLEMINKSDADFFVSIHLNAIPSPRWSGAQTFYAPHMEENRRAAKFIQDELRRNLENTNRKAKPINGVYILKNADKPGVLVEIGFLSNPAEKENLKNEVYQEMIAASIYKGIIRYFTAEKELLESNE